MGKQQFRKVAKKTICWLLILGMLVTLPQFPMTQVSAAEVNTEMIEELDSTELKEAETETTETELSETTEAEGADTEKTAETEEDQDTETEEGEDTEAADSEAAENEAVDEETDVKAATSTDLTIHFKKVDGWTEVYTQVGSGDSWTAISGLEYCKNGMGGIVKENSKNSGWYSFKVTKNDAETVNGLFNNGSWGTGTNQTENFSITITENTMEVWITTVTENGKITPGVSTTEPTGWVSGETVTAPVDPATLSNVKSPALKADGSVTFNYEISADTLGTEKLYLMGTITDWTTGKEMTDEDGDGVYSITISDKAPGNYEYKFKYGDTWVTDPANSKYSNGNSLVTIPGLGEATIEAKLGATTALPETLKLYNEDGTSTDVAPTYALKEAVAGATISGTNLVLDDTVTATYIAVTATYGSGKTYTSTVHVNVVAEQYNYHIYYYADNPDRVTADSAALWLYGKNVDGTLHNFTDVEEINGYTWLKYTWTTSLSDISIIARNPVDWTWQAATVNYTNKDKAEDVNIYIIHGNTKAYTTLPDIAVENQKHYVLVEYKRTNNDYDGWNIYTWDSGYDDTVTFTDYNGIRIAAIRVAASNESVSFCMRHSTEENEWESKDGGDHMVKITPGQVMTKVLFEEGKGIVSYYPDNLGYEMRDGTLNLYYRDDELFAENKAGDFSSVKVEFDSNTYELTYNFADQRWEKTGIELTEGKHYYRYLVKADANSAEESKLDLFNDQKETVNGQEYNVLEYYKFNASVSGSFSQSTMDYGDNNVLKVNVDSDKANGTIAFKASEVTVDLTTVGGKKDFGIKPELMEGAIAVKEGTAAGTYSLPITVIDQYGNTYTGTSSVEVKAREKENDFDWDEAVIYFAVTDRFYDGNTANNDAYGVGDYNTDPATGSLSYHGGDFAGLTQKLDYLSQLGVNTIWITPIVANEMKEGLTTDLPGTLSYGYHGYWASDFTTLNKHLGTEEEFKTLLDSAHAKGMKIMVDVVLNHAGYETEDYFNSKLNGKDMIRSGENLIEGDTKKGPLSGLPDFMTEDQDVRNLLVEWQSSWISKYDIDYYRIDTVKHVDDVTWAAFKNALTKIDPDFKMIGEYSGAGYGSDTGTLGTGEMDSLLDFDFNDQALAFVKGNIDSVETFMENRNAAIDNTATLGAFTSSHDEDGLMQKIIDEGYTEAQAYQMFLAAASLQMTAKGQVVIYYGEEIGQYGKDNYPYQTNRYDFDWSKAQLADGSLNTSDTMLAHYRKLLAIRNTYSEVLAKGDRVKVAGSDAEGYLVFQKSYQGETVYVGINLKDEAVTVNNIAVTGSGYKDVYGNAAMTEADGKVSVTIPALSAGGTVVLGTRDLNGTEVKAESITLNKTDLKLAKGKTYALKANVTPAGSVDGAVTWSSSKKSVAKVDANGVVTAVKKGTAVITATTAGGLKAECKVTVTIPAAKVYLTPAMTIKKGTTRTLTASVFPKDTTDKITWKTSNKKVVTVTAKGKIKGVKAGTATITATASNGKKATCKVTVVKSSKKSTSIKLSKKTLTVNKGAYKQLKATITKNSTDKITWSSSNKKVATVDKNGVVVGVKKGTATITAKTSSGKKATCKVTVKVPATKVKLNKTKVTLAKGKSVTLKATLTPTNSTDKLTWTTSNKKVATVTSKGKVTAVKKGTATITVKTTSGKKATCKVTVK